MKIGIISDSHDHQENVRRAIDIFNQHQVAYIFHAGDIVAPFTAKAFAQAQGARLIAVYGNNDGEMLFLQSTIKKIHGEIHEYCYRRRLESRDLFMTHTPHFLDELIKSQSHDLIIYGHTHEPDIRREGRTLVINPGESTDWLTDQPQVVVLNLDDMRYESIALKQT